MGGMPLVVISMKDVMVWMNAGRKVCSLTGRLLSWQMTQASIGHAFYQFEIERLKTVIIVRSSDEKQCHLIWSTNVTTLRAGSLTTY